MDYTAWHNGIAIPIFVTATVKIGIGSLIYLAVRRRRRVGVAQH